MSDNPKRRSSLNITLDDSYTSIDFSDSFVFKTIVGDSKIEKMAGENSNSGSEGTIMTAYTVSIDKTVEHVTRMVPEFSGGLEEKLDFFITACELVSDIIPIANKDIMFRTILTKLKSQAHELVKYETIDSWVKLKTI